MDNNIMTMEYLNNDFWGRPVYKCVETDILYKDLSRNNQNPELYSCGNMLDGEPCCPVKKDLVIRYRSKYKPSPYKFEYLLLGRLQQDCNYYLGNGLKNPNNLWAGSELEQIEKMKELYNIFPESEKPEWLTWQQILEYEEKLIG